MSDRDKSKYRRRSQRKFPKQPNQVCEYCGGHDCGELQRHHHNGLLDIAIKWTCHKNHFKTEQDQHPRGADGRFRKVIV